MRRFVFLGSKRGWFGEGEIEYDGFKLCTVYLENEKSRNGDFTVLDFATNFPDDWAQVGVPGRCLEVFNEEPEQLLYQTDLGYYAGLFAMQGCMIDQAIIRAKELIKQLKEEEQHGPL